MNTAGLAALAVVNLGVQLHPPAPESTPRPTPWIIAFMGAVTPAVDPACGVSFKIPPDWEISTRVESQGNCRISVRPPGWLKKVTADEIDLGDYAFVMDVRAIRRSVEDEMSGEGFRKDRDGQWETAGKAGPGGGVEISGPGWTGLQGWPGEGFHYKRGGYFGIGDTQRAMFWDGGTRVAFLNALPGPFDYPFRLVVATFSFLSPKNPVKE